MRMVFDLVEDYTALQLAARNVFGANNSLRALFPVAPVDDIRYRMQQRRRVDTVGHVRSLDTPARQIRRGGLIDVRGEIPAVSAMDTLLESDLLRARQLAGTPIADLVGASVAQSAADVSLAIDNAYEFLRGMALFGRIAIDNGEVVQTVEFGTNPDLEFTAGTLWDDPDADVIADLQAWSDAYAGATDGGGLPQRAITSRRVFNTALRHPSVLRLFAVNGTAPALITPDALGTLFQSYGLPRLETYDRRIDGARVTPENVIAFLPDGQIGSTFQGITEQAVQLAGRGILDNTNVAGVTVVTMVSDHPVSRSVAGDSYGLPVLLRASDMAYATVLPAA